ncbi:twin-arginine translocation protein, TatA/E family subunit [Alkaliphilus metalliredigens QYMF]|uniref:Sec-independent protein translocase protein TatA n=1 Tax=Alkaliphilus metalliredigens (strain QYMF) TaxID=293826 RepID=TATA_ALKMQ|nr:twin-arginine translocase TatA/TatE family subunit [Alkaliphilus metalliredigens]A6TLZ3.1 RecName: Full=Sec-independent protein translocase protein TatA [Alkaliphilus metalliredigens QYMF]ABR47211.1 twin-arginine translocation protein, TatA/E family subunit [Alkaliphilus metalliredigens QYMF]
MFGKLGMPELVLIFAVALVIFGPSKLPEIGKSLGKSIKEFKKFSKEMKDDLSLEERETKDKDTVKVKEE